MSKTILYSYWLSTCSWRVRLALNLKGISYEYKAVNLQAMEQRSREYLDMNPMGQVPTLAIHGLHLRQSLAIIEYLDDRFENQPLIPKNSATAAEARAIALHITAAIQPMQNIATVNYVADLTDKQKARAMAQHFNVKGLDELEKVLEKSAGQYCVGDQITVADLWLVPQLYHSRTRFKVNVDQHYPIMSRIDKTLAEMPAFIKSHAVRQPDTPEALKKNV